MTLNELQERIRATRAAGWHVLPPEPDDELAAVAAAALGDAPVASGAGSAAAGPSRADRHHHRAVLRADVDVVLEWGRRESSLEYYEPWVGNVARKGRPVEAERILLDVRYRGSLVDRLRGLELGDLLLPFPRSRDPRVKGLADRFFPRAEAEVWALAHALQGDGERTFERAIFDSGLRIE